MRLKCNSPYIFFNMLIFHVKIICTAFFLSLYAIDARANELHVVVYLSGPSAPYESVYSTIKKGLDNENHKIKLTKRVVEDNPQSIPTENKKTLYISVGAKATIELLQASLDIPIISVLIPKKTFYSIINEYEIEEKISQGKVSAIFLDQPPSRQIEFVKLLLPKTKRLGIPLGKDSELLFNQYVAASKSLKLDIQPYIATSHNEVSSIFDEMTKEVDAILIYPSHDVITPNTAKWLLYMAYQRKKPVIAYSKSFVKAGALAAIYSTPEQQGQEVTQLLLNYLSSGNEKLPPPRFPTTFNLKTNTSVANSLGIKLSEIENLKEIIKKRVKGR